MSIFPSFQIEVDKNNKALSLPIPKELAIDFTTGDLIVENGDFVIVEENEAIKVWCYYALKIAKARFLAFSNNYGNEFEDKLIGKNYYSYNKENIKKMVEECLLVNKYIKSIDEIDYEFEDDRLTLNITITTIYSKGVEINV